MSKYYDPNIPRGIPLHERKYFAVGESASQSYTVPADKVAVITAIKFSLVGLPFRKITDEPHATSGGKVTLTGDGASPGKNIYLVDSIHEVADGIYNDPDQLNHEWYYTDGHQSDDYAKSNPFTGECWLEDSSHSNPGDGVDVFADYMYMDWEMQVSVPSLPWSWSMGDLKDLINAFMIDASGGEQLVFLYLALSGTFVQDWTIEGGGTLVPQRIYVPLTTNVVVDEGEDITLGISNIQNWGDGAYILGDIFGFLVDKTEWGT